MLYHPVLTCERCGSRKIYQEGQYKPQGAGRLYRYYRCRDCHSRTTTVDYVDNRNDKKFIYQYSK